MGKIIALEYFNGTDSDLVAAATGFAVFIISLFGIKIWAKKAASATEYKPFIEDIVE
jgi:hypothetical protein